MADRVEKINVRHHAESVKPLMKYGDFWATVCKTVRPMLSDRWPVCLSVCLSVCPVWDVGLFWPNGWVHQNETWHAGRPRPWPHCVRRGL